MARERAAAPERQERRSQRQARDLALQAVDDGRQLADAGDQLGAMRATVPVQVRERARASRTNRRSRPAGRGLLAGRELVEMPAETVLGPRALGHEVVAVVDEQAHLSLGAVEAGDRQVGLAQGGPGDREGIDGVALAGLATGAAGPGHELGRHADDRLARDEQVALQAAGEVAAVLEGPAPLAEALASPGQQLEMPGRGGGHRRLGELATLLVDGDERVAALVQIGPDRHHVRVSFLIREVDHGPVGGHA